MQAGGNEALALVNAVTGNVIGIFVTPALLLAYLGATGQASYTSVLTKLAGTVIGPLVVGQLVQYFKPEAVKWLQGKISFPKTGSIMILLLVWATFCNTFASKVEADPGSVIGMMVIVAGLYVIFMGMALSVGFAPLNRLLGINRADAIAIAMCGATKTVALGIPLIGVIYANSPKAGILAVPLLMYHALQILIGHVLIPPLKRWKERGDDDVSDTKADAEAAAAAVEQAEEVPEGAPVLSEAAPPDTKS